MCSQDVMLFGPCGHEKDYGSKMPCADYGEKDIDGRPLCKGTTTKVTISGAVHGTRKLMRKNLRPYDEGATASSAFPHDRSSTRES
jgi:hypothetical protein